MLKEMEYILNHTRSLWDSVSGKSFFIAGGTGFIGRWLLESFAYINHSLELNNKLYVLARTPDKFLIENPGFKNHSDIVFIKGDVRSFEFPGRNVDYIVQAASGIITNLTADNSFELMDTIVAGTRRMLNFARQSNTKRFLFLSSGAVYGKQPDELMSIPESYNGTPESTDANSVYGQSKRMAEMLCGIYNKHYGIGTVVARCFAFIGPYLSLDDHYAIGNFIRDSLNKKPIIVTGDGTPLRSYLYAADMAVWLWTILFKGTPATAYNVGSDIPISIADLAHKVAAVSGMADSVQILKKPPATAIRQRYIPCIDKAKLELKLDCQTNIDDAIKKTMQFYSRKGPS